jgi:plasmid stabilization system protein ParE
MLVQPSPRFRQDIAKIFKYGVETFGLIKAIEYENEVLNIVNQLTTNYNLWPECRHIPTEKREYRNIIIDNYLIIYRITNTRIEVLCMISSYQSVAKIKAIRKINF